MLSCSSANSNRIGIPQITGAELGGFDGTKFDDELRPSHKRDHQVVTHRTLQPDFSCFNRPDSAFSRRSGERLAGQTLLPGSALRCSDRDRWVIEDSRASSRIIGRPVIHLGRSDLIVDGCWPKPPACRLSAVASSRRPIGWSKG